MILRAIHLATKAHAGQVRKYTGDPYILHCLEVAETVRRARLGEAAQSAAVLHDVLEDTVITSKTLYRVMGDYVTGLVIELTDLYVETHHGNRAKRKALERERLATISEEGQVIKIADLMSNTKDIVMHDPEFAKVYLDEKEQLLRVLTKAQKYPLYDEAWAALNVARLQLV